MSYTNTVDLIHRLGLVEKAGSGIKRMQKLAKEDNVTVLFKTGMFFEVIFHRKIDNRAEKRSKSEAKPKQIGWSSDVIRTQFGHKNQAKMDFRLFETKRHHQKR